MKEKIKKEIKSWIDDTLGARFLKFLIGSKRSKGFKIFLIFIPIIFILVIILIFLFG